MISIKNTLRLLVITLASSTASFSQVCIPTYATVCESPGVFDVIDNFWTEGAEINITNMDSDCNLLPDNYWYTGQSMTVCAGDVITTNAQCEVGEYEQGFAIWVDWDEDDIFEPAEKVYSSPGFGFEVFTGTFTIPGDVIAGESFNMRVRCEFATAGAGIDPCDFQTYGETEDYIIVIGSCAPTICDGDTAVIDLGVIPGVISYEWSPATDISDPFGGPIVEVWPSDTTTYTCTITSVDSTWDVVHEVFVVYPSDPMVGVDDTICHDVLVPFPLDGEMTGDEEDFSLEWDFVSFSGVGAPATVYTPGDDVLDTEVQVSLPGTYEFVLTSLDFSGVCPEQSDTLFVTFSEALHELEGEDPSCFGAFDGTITVTGTGTLPSVEYSIDGGVTWQASNVFTGLPSGVHTVISRDAAGCEFESEFELFDPEEVVITTSSDSLICQNGTATVEAEATGGVFFTYDWSIPGADDGATQDVSPDVSPYLITVTAFNELGCSSEEATIEITLMDPITLSITVNDSICPGFESESTVFAEGGDGVYTYTWTESGAASPESSSTISGNPFENTSYCVTVNDGCETTPESICTQAIMRPVPEPIFTSDITAGCDPSTAAFETVLLPGDESVWTIDGNTFTGPAELAYEFAGVGFYDVSLQITNEYGCVNDIDAFNYFEVVDIPYPDFYINPNPTTIFNTQVRLTPYADGNMNTYEWYTPGALTDNSTEESPIVVYPEGVPGTYPIDLTVTNEYGCSNTVSGELEVLPDVLIYAPNIFTPDGDQYNEGWQIYIDGIDIYNYHCQVFNRWGEIVWESYDPSAIWYGTYGAENAPDGTYVWMVTAKEQTNDRRLEFQGTVSIMR